MLQAIIARDFLSLEVEVSDEAKENVREAREYVDDRDFDHVRPGEGLHRAVGHRRSILGHLGQRGLQGHARRQVEDVSDTLLPEDQPLKVASLVHELPHSGRRSTTALGTSTSFMSVATPSSSVPR